MKQTTGNSEYTFEKVWKMFEETDRQFKETNKKFQETDRQFKETDRKFDEFRKEAAERSKETDRQFKETNKKISKISGMFSSQWGKLMEALIKPACLKLFKARNIDVNRTYSNVKIKSNQTDAEFDIVLANGSEVVIVEVKTDMSVEHVNYFLEKLANIKTYFPEYADMKIYGAVAGIRYSENSDKYAYRQGLFVLRNSGDYIIEIANPDTFTPKIFG